MAESEHSGTRSVPNQIEEFSDEYTETIVELVIGILQNEFGFSESAAQQPDLLDISEHYGHGRSNFWLATEGEQLVGTIGFLDLGSGQGLLRKMFVRSQFRGAEAAQLLFDRLLAWSRSHGFEELYLGTNSKFHAAHRFYLKHNFELVQTEDLPDTVPRMELRDTFFRRSLAQP